MQRIKHRQIHSKIETQHTDNMKTDTQYQPKTGAACSCRPGIQRDNCPSCEGTGQVIDFAAIRARKDVTMAPLTVEAFAQREGITMTAKRVDSNPNMPDREMDHWKCEFKINSPVGARKMTVYFSMGLGHNGKAPELPEVLNCVASDARAGFDMTFEDFCSEFGYDCDSMKAHNVFKACEKAYTKLQNFIGHERGTVLHELLYEVESL